MSTIIMTRLQTLVDGHPCPIILDETLLSRVFSHKSLFARPAHVQIAEDEPEDWERLAFLGDQILGLYVSEILFRRHLRAKNSFLTNRRSLVVSNDQVARWSNAYGLPNRIRAHPAQISVVRSTVAARAAVFEAYLAAVYLSEGSDRAQNWVKPLIELVLEEADEREETEDSDSGDSIISPNLVTLHPRGIPLKVEPPDSTSHPRRISSRTVEPPDLTDFGDMSLRDRLERGYHERTSLESTPLSGMPLLNPGSVTPTQLRPATLDNPFYYNNGVGGSSVGGSLPKVHSSKRSNTLGFNPHGSSTTSSTPAPVTQAPITPRSMSVSSSKSSISPSTSSSTSASYAISAGQGGGFLALFNQIASQKRIYPAWETSRTGPDHRPTFVAAVYVDGKEEGKGQAFNKQTAKHLAAKQALKNLRWHAE
ncbi:hypothetical protein FRC20_007497 [Serendipita sp. 405]|nr:hypothetical protein FRC20_007497 [Serendipita sp. 405]